MDEQIKDLFYEAIHAAFMDNHEFSLEAKNVHSNDAAVVSLVVFPRFETTETETNDDFGKDEADG